MKWLDDRLARMPRQKAFLVLVFAPAAAIPLFCIPAAITGNYYLPLAGWGIMIVLHQATANRREALAACRGCGEPLNVSRRGLRFPSLAGICPHCGTLREAPPPDPNR